MAHGKNSLLLPVRWLGLVTALRAFAVFLLWVCARVADERAFVTAGAWVECLDVFCGVMLAGLLNTVLAKKVRPQSLLSLFALRQWTHKGMLLIGLIVAGHLLESGPDKLLLVNLMTFLPVTFLLLNWAKSESRTDAPVKAGRKFLNEAKPSLSIGQLQVLASVTLVALSGALVSRTTPLLWERAGDSSIRGPGTYSWLVAIYLGGQIAGGLLLALPDANLAVRRSLSDGRWLGHITVLSGVAIHFLPVSAASVVSFLVALIGCGFFGGVFLPIFQAHVSRRFNDGALHFVFQVTGWVREPASERSEISSAAQPASVAYAGDLGRNRIGSFMVELAGAACGIHLSRG